MGTGAIGGNVVAKHVERPAFRAIKRSPYVTDLVFSPRRAVRSKVSNRDSRLTEHYAADGSLVKITLVAAETDRELSRRVDEAVRTGNLWIGIDGAAEKLGISASTLRRAAREGKLKTRRIGRTWITSVAWMEAYAQSRRPAGRPRKGAASRVAAGPKKAALSNGRRK
jgi:excisionase family DNA binding protein